jgi:predicted kinase
MAAEIAPEAVVFCGLQASGKTSFYVQRFLHTHARINLDLLGSRAREQAFLRTCVATRQSFVVDKVNATAMERRRYIQPALAAGFRVTAYWFHAPLRQAIARNDRRAQRSQVPHAAILGTHKRIEAPSEEEGFDTVHLVTIDADGEFDVQRPARTAGTTRVTRENRRWPARPRRGAVVQPLRPS